MSVTVPPVLTVVSVPTARGHLIAPVTVLGMMAICVKTVSENIRGSRKFFQLFYILQADNCSFFMWPQLVLRNFL